MKIGLMEFLACPICKNHPLELLIFEEREEIIEGLISCKSCNRWYPIIDEIPHMLPDGLRKNDEDLHFLKKWKGKVPQKILKEGKPFHLN